MQEQGKSENNNSMADGDLLRDLNVTLNRHGPAEEIERQLVRLFDAASGCDVNPR